MKKCLLVPFAFVISMHAPGCAVSSQEDVTKPDETSDSTVIVTSIKLNGDAKPTITHHKVSKLAARERFARPVPATGELNTAKQPIYNYDGFDFCPSDSLLLWSIENYGTGTVGFDIYSCIWGTGTLRLDDYVTGCRWSHDPSFVTEDNPTGSFCSGMWKGSIMSLQNLSYSTCRFTGSWLGFPFYRYGTFTFYSQPLGGYPHSNPDTSASDIRNAWKVECW